MHESTAATWSDERGYYELRELVAGFFFVGVDDSGRQHAGGSALNLHLTLEQGESREFGFGRPVALPRWSGQVRTRPGSVVPNRPGGVRRAGALHLLRRADENYARHEFEQDGSFSVALEPGSYTVKTWRRRIPDGVLGGVLLFCELQRLRRSAAGGTHCLDPPRRRARRGGPFVGISDQARITGRTPPWLRSSG